MTDVKPPFVGDDEDYSPPPPWHERLSDNVPALLSFIVLVVIVIWGLFHLLALAQPWFSSLVPSRPATTATVPTSADTGLPRPVLRAPATTTTSVHATAKPVTHVSPTVPATPADLVVRILAVGVIDPATGAFVNRTPASPADVAAVQFDIANEGGSSTGVWYFDAQLPTTYAGYLYTSPGQEPLGPGDHIINTLRFTPVISGGGIFNVIIDPQGRVNESNKTNNTATQFIPMVNYY